MCLMVANIVLWPFKECVSDGQTDIPSYKDARMHLKMQINGHWSSQTDKKGVVRLCHKSTLACQRSLKKCLVMLPRRTVGFYPRRDWPCKCEELQ